MVNPTFQSKVHAPPRTGSIKSEESYLYRNPMTEESWRRATSQVQSCLKSLDQDTLQPAVEKISEGILWLDTIMDRYCDLTCPTCEDPCCSGQKVFFNQADILYLAASGGNFPPGQTRETATEPCRYITKGGCRLPRISRPYVCVWFLCDPQMALFQDEPAAFQRKFIEVLMDVRTSRLILESLYDSLFPNGNREVITHYSSG